MSMTFPLVPETASTYYQQNPVALISELSYREHMDTDHGKRFGKIHITIATGRPETNKQ